MITASKGISPESMSSDKPFYVLYMDRVRKNISDMNDAFKKLYGNFVIAYSFKTNYLKPVIDAVLLSGGMAEVVSPYEHEYAKCYLHIPPRRIVYNGVTPDAVGKFYTARSGGMVNVDNFREYAAISKLANEKKENIRLGVRVNFPISNGLCSRFGLDTDGNEFWKLMGALERDEYVSFSGFHCHIGTARPVRFWAEKASKIIELAQKFNAGYIDLGGGMYGPMIPELSSQFQDYAGSFADYANAVCSMMKEAFPDERVMLIVEPGTAIVGNTMDLYCHVTDIKTVRGSVYITVDTCSNHLGMICECRTIPADIAASSNGGDRSFMSDATIAGCTCLEFDYIRKGFSGHVAVGDVIRFQNVGAYSLCASRQFIVPRPAVYSASDGELIRIDETTADMFLHYCNC